MASLRNRNAIVHLAFEVGVALKGLNGLLEIVGAALVLVVDPGRLSRIVKSLTQREFLGNSHDAVSNYLVHAAEQVTGSEQRFAFLYLLSHGVLKVALVWALLRSKLWAYPAAIAVFVAFGVYQTYRYSISHSAEMLILTVLDVFVIALTIAEYKRVRQVHEAERMRTA